MLFLIVVFFQIATTDSAALIRTVREQVDLAFQRHDVKQLATLVSSDFHFTSLGTHTDGSDVLERHYESLFARRPDVTLTHQPNRIVVNERWDVASEQGNWIERWTEKDGVTELRGIYLTMWKRDDGRWREYSETIVPEACSGSSYCH
jgi:ketosteroid isomerase-like protein